MSCEQLGLFGGLSLEAVDRGAEHNGLPASSSRQCVRSCQLAELVFDGEQACGEEAAVGVERFLIEILAKET